MQYSFVCQFPADSRGRPTRESHPTPIPSPINTLSPPSLFTLFSWRTTAADFYNTMVDHISWWSFFHTPHARACYCVHPFLFKPKPAGILCTSPSGLNITVRVEGREKALWQRVGTVSMNEQNKSNDNAQENNIYISVLHSSNWKRWKRQQ